MNLQKVVIDEMRKRSQVKVIYESETTIVLYDSYTEGYFIHGEESSIPALREMKLESDIYFATDEVLKETLCELSGRSDIQICHQFVYEKESAPVIDSDLTFSVPTLSEVDLILEHYKEYPREYIEEFIQEESILAGYLDGAMVGFVGLHTDGSMGLLDVLPQYRRKGYGSAMVASLIQSQLEKGRVPYGHVMVDNEQSYLMQIQLGFSLAPKKAIWIF